MEQRTPADPNPDAVNWNAANPQTIAAELKELLSATRDVEAVHLLIGALDHHVMPTGKDLLHWLRSSFASAQIEQLVHALGSEPCQFCEKGLEKCGDCNPEQVSPTCPQCLGFGKQCCDFCNGTGLAAYDFLPVEVWGGIITKRTNLAVSLAVMLLQRPMPQPDDPHAQKALRDCLRNANKLLAVLDNAVSVLPTIAAEHDRPAAWMQEVRDRCFRSAGALETRVRDCLRMLAQLSRPPAAPGVTEPPHTPRSKFLQKLADSPAFEQTMLAHPGLFGKPG